MRNQVLNGDSAEVLKTFPDECFDACVTDPPYGLGTKEPTGEEIDAFLSGREGLKTGDFMGKAWDLPSVALWREVYRTMKPGAVVMSFAGTRTLDLMAGGIEAAGFTYVGVCGWVHGQGFPKSLNISRALDKIARGAPQGGPDPQKSGKGKIPQRTAFAKGGATGKAITGFTSDYEESPPVTEDAKKWEGYGTALKPSWEPVLCFTKGDSDWKMPPVPFFYCAKAAKSEKSVEGEVENNHVTVKPLRLMQWLVGLAAPKGSLILEPFLGSGTTAAACAEEGRDFVGIERDPHYFELARKRVGVVKGKADEIQGQRDLFDLAMSLDEE